jgi:ABC transport system ATP-binding/permease protein
MLPARWGFGASAASVDLVSIAPGTPPDALWHHETGQWIFDLAMLGGLTVCYTAAAIVALRKRLAGPQR